MKRALLLGSVLLGLLSVSAYGEGSRYGGYGSGWRHGSCSTEVYRGRHHEPASRCRVYRVFYRRGCHCRWELYRTLDSRHEAMYVAGHLERRGFETRIEG